jgi:hypothetical protein
MAAYFDLNTVVFDPAPFALSATGWQVPLVFPAGLNVVGDLIWVSSYLRALVLLPEENLCRHEIVGLRQGGKGSGLSGG